MDILDIIKTRRSIRAYKKNPPTDSEIEKILEAGRWAPSGLNNQPWRFMVIKDGEKKRHISQLTKYSDIIVNAPVLVVVCMDRSSSYDRDKDLMAVGASIQNMLLQAHAMGVGTCWLGEILSKKENLKKYLALKEDLEVMAVITVGYPAETAQKGTRFPLKDLRINS